MTTTAETELDRVAVGAILGRYRLDGKAPEPYSQLTVYRYWKDVPGQFASYPFPAPAGYHGRTGYWSPSQIPAIEAWAKHWEQARPGSGAGGGRPWSPPPILDDGYIPCAQCEHPIERHESRVGCRPLKGKCGCAEMGWTTGKIRGARLAAGLSQRFTLDGSTV
jgi:hypothetical protein